MQARGGVSSLKSCQANQITLLPVNYQQNASVLKSPTVSAYCFLSVLHLFSFLIFKTRGSVRNQIFKSERCAKDDGYAWAAGNCSSHRRPLCLTAAEKATLFTLKAFCLKPPYVHDDTETLVLLEPSDNPGGGGGSHRKLSKWSCSAFRPKGSVAQTAQRKLQGAVHNRAESPLCGALIGLFASFTSLLASGDKNPAD